MINIEKTTQQRVVPSGKVYRQIFDAEVQLVRALEQKKPAFEDEAKAISINARTEEEAQHIPLVRDDTQLTGMLSTRQTTWINGFPNEGSVENPVLYKFFMEEDRRQFREPEASKASKEVQSLPDVLSPAKKGSDIISRIAESRRQRHEAAIEDMHHELGIVTANLEPQIQAVGDELMNKLVQNDQVIQEILEKIASDDSLVDYTIESLNALWQEVALQSTVRQGWIRDLDQTLHQLEDGRTDKVREIFQNNSDVLKKIAFLMPSDLSRLLDKESQSLNQTLLSNRRAYADLYARLMISDIEREKRLHTKWKNRLDHWKILHVNLAVNHFRDYMTSEEVLAPSTVQDILIEMYEEQERLNNQRLKLVDTLREFRPPYSTKTSVYHWNDKLTSVSKIIDELNQKYFNEVYGEYEKVCQRCLGKVERLKLDLIDRQVCTEQEATTVVTDSCLPLVGERQTLFEQDLEAMDKDLEKHNIAMIKQIKSLFKFLQGAAHVWDVHEIGLARQERALQEKLDQCRLLHDTQNQDKEANLDIVMDRMRQEATEKALDESLKKSLDMLTKIKEAYGQFHKDQVEIVTQYPDMVRGELVRHDDSVCKFFDVNRKHPDDIEEAVSASPDPPKIKPTGSKSKKKSAKSRTSSGKSESSSTYRESPLPLVVSEILNSAKGTTFYVLTVAGIHGIPKADTTPRDKGRDTDREVKVRDVDREVKHRDIDREIGDTEEEEEEEDILEGAFITEVEEANSCQLKPYLQKVNIDSAMILDIKKVVRMNFIDHLESWIDQSEDRAKAVVAAKTEELNSELDLRMHLHAPRSRRAELDIHNVRAAELMMHGERVSRHCKGVNQALTDLKHRFGQMTEEHNKLAAQFRADIEALEIIFINATKSCRLIALSNQLQVQQDQFMEKIRASLRQFRQHLDDTLQMLRESNARFIKSFKVFSDGGNFCPEEIDDYRKRLEKMSQKIDASEGFVMADLEGMESKRLEQASKIAREFEDRFKHHMVDLVFMEKIARWLTNTQVKIKAEVADSNSQAQRLTQFLNDLDRRIDACEKPNLDKESVTPSQLNDFFKSILNSYHDRSVYLDCIKAAIKLPSTAALQGNPALGARVGFVSENVAPISKPGKQSQEDPSVNVIKNILKTRKDRQRFGMEAELDGDSSSATLQINSSHMTLPSQSSIGIMNVVRDSKSRQSRLSDVETRSKRSNSKPGTASNSTLSEKLGRTGSGKPGKIDKKFYIFGELHEEGEETNFLGRIRRVLRETLDGLLSASELYYRLKGTRLVTRPQALQETLEECAVVINQKLLSYYKQADKYHNQCLQEFARQLSQLEDLVAHIPGCLIKELVSDSISVARQQHRDLDLQFASKLQELDDQKRRNEADLRPALGHPQQAESLQALCDVEEQRTLVYREGIETNTREQQELAVKQAQEFISELATASETLLLQFDQLLTMDDVNKGRVPPIKHSTSELLRRKNAGKPLDEEVEITKVTRGKNTWPGLNKNELILPVVPLAVEKQATVAPSPVPTLTPARKRSKPTPKKESTTTATVTTQKTTLGHTATIVTRDHAYQEYKKYFEGLLHQIENTKDKQIISGQRWTESWTKSVNKIKALY